ncbi:MAG: hypothetical protein K9M54_04045 [Kiritimatiellales bacterium]|nr:hypothetical protein [Kiritimatiellales bacterium]
MKTLKPALLGFGLSRLVITLAMGMAGIAAAATNEYVGLTRTLQTAGNWSGGLPNNAAVIKDWLIGGPGFQNYAYNQTTADLVNTSATDLRLYVDTIYLASGVNNLSNTTSGIMYDLGFNFGAAAGNKIVVKTGFDIAADVTNNVILKAGRWVSTNASDVITFNHNGSGILKSSNDWIENAVGLVYKGSAMNQVAFGLASTAASTWTGGTTLDNVAASLTANNSIGKNGSVVLTNGASLNMATYILNNNTLIAAAGTDVKQISVSGVSRSSAIEAQGNMRLYNTTGTATWTGTVTVDSGTELEVDNAVNGIVTSLSGTLAGAGTLRTPDKGTIVINTALDSSGFAGDIIMDAGVVQFKNDNQFGPGSITLNGPNFRGFITAVDNLDYSVTNNISVLASSRMAMTAAGGLAGNDGSVTFDGDIVFATNATLTMEAGGNADNFAAVNTLNINGVISESSAGGNVTVDNHWLTAYYTNSITKFFATNTYSGTTLVQFGRLQLVGDASIDSSSILEVQAGGVLDVSTRTGGAYTFANIFRGKGQIDGDMTLTGLIQPGAGTGTLTFNDDLSLTGSGTLAIEVYGYNGTNDVLANDGGDAFTLDPGYTLNFSFINWAPAEAVTNGTVITVLENWASLNGAGGNNVVVTGLSGQTIDTSNLLVDGTVTVVSSSPFDSWVAGYNLTGADALATADPDGDGLSNLYEYGLNGNPTNGTDTGTSPTFGSVNVGGTNYFGYIYPQLSDVNSGLAYSLNLTTDLVNIPWTNTGYIVWGTNVTGGALDFVTNVTTTVAAQKFIRLIIENL